NLKELTYLSLLSRIRIGKKVNHTEILTVYFVQKCKLAYLDRRTHCFSELVKGRENWLSQHGYFQQ
ncbi:hypothetical protein CGJ28_25400, partial [Vibrio parahaemolyticus]